MSIVYPDVPSLLDDATQAIVAAACERHLTREALAPLIDLGGFLETGKLFPKYGDWSRRAAFWTEEGEKIGDGAPEPVWRTCTDLWANTFAAPERIVDVMMASGLYEARTEAEAVLETYCAQTHGAGIFDLGTEELHVYAPTGYGVHRDNFDTVFAAPEIPRLAWQENVYVLSTRPLGVDAELLLDHDWREPDFRQPRHAPAGPEVEDDARFTP